MSYNEEYFCPNCGAILNTQPGFDPDKGTWTCTVCGQTLMDDDVFDGDSFEGVAWYCDNCGALLNRQHGFSDSYGSWICTECGHINGTTEDDIINIDHGRFKCPNCGASLDNQSGFSEYSNDNVCEECGAHLHRDYSWNDFEVKEEPKFTCPNCGSSLDNQPGFSEYSNDNVCEECGAHLHRDYSWNDFEVKKEPKFTCPNCGSSLDDQWGFSDYNDDWTCTECGAHLHHDYSWEEYEEIVDNAEEDEADDEDETDNENEEVNDNDGEDETDEEDEEEQTIGYSGSYSGYPSIDYSRPSSGTYSQSYQSATKKQRPSRSSQRSIKKQRPSRSSQRSAKKQKSSRSSQHSSKRKTGTIIRLVLLVLVLGFFGVEYLIHSLSPNEEKARIVEDHTGEVKVSFSASSVQGENYYDVMLKARKDGLTRIRVTPLEDLKTGILTKEGTVETIEINGISDFYYGTWFKEDSVVSITYHSFSKKEKDGFDDKKNKSIVCHRVVFTLPSYLVESESSSSTSLQYRVKSDDESVLTIEQNTNGYWKEIDEYDTHLIIENKPLTLSNIDGQYSLMLAKKSNKVYRIETVSFPTNENSHFMIITLISPNDSKVDYSSDYYQILSHVFIPSESEVQVSLSLKEMKGKHYSEVVDLLSKDGFKNIKAIEEKDLVTGWITKEGSVDSVTINGSTEYNVGDWFDENVEIVITYHSKK